MLTLHSVSIVRDYVEGLKESSAALLDLLAATGAAADEDMAKQRGPRKAMYSDVSQTSSRYRIAPVGF